MVQSSHEIQSDKLFAASAPGFFSGAPVLEKPDTNRFEAPLREVLARGFDARREVAMVLTSYLADKLSAAPSPRPSDKYADIAMMVGAMLAGGAEVEAIMRNIGLALR